jgi:L-aminopeptidase/D-esterase-like protein
VGALVVCNALGDVIDPQNGRLIAGARTAPDTLSLLDTSQALLQGMSAAAPTVGANTSIGVVACNARLDKAQAQRLAVAGHDGLARSIRPVHTPMDGDTLFGLATGTCDLPPEPMLLCAMAAEAVALATVDAVRAATSLRLGDQWWPAARELA